MYPSFESIPPHKFIPGFYFLAQHGVGNASLAYYLTWLGVIPTRTGDVVPQKNNISFLVPKCPQTYLYGLNVDMLPKKDENIVESGCHGSVIWLVRDPVLALTSNLNWHIGRVAFSKGDFSFLSKNNIPNHIKFCFYYSNLFDSIRDVVPSDDRSLIVQTKDISGPNCIDTLKKIALYLNIPYRREVEDIAAICFNSYKNRLWSYQPMKFYPIKDHNVCYFNVAPSKLFDFWFNHWTKAYILGKFEYNGDEYTAGLPMNSISGYPESILEIIWKNIDMECLEKWIDIWQEHCTVTQRIYERYAFTPDKLIDYFINNRALHSWYVSHLDNEIKIFAKNNPQIIDSWEYYNQLANL